MLCEDSIDFCYKNSVTQVERFRSYALMNGNYVMCRPGCEVCSATNPEFCLRCKYYYYLNYATGKCSKCKKGCKVCADFNVCNYCGVSNNLVSGNCVACQGHCLTCSSANPQLCYSCAPGYSLNLMGSTCSLSCPTDCLHC